MVLVPATFKVTLYPAAALQHCHQVLKFMSAVNARHITQPVCLTYKQTHTWDQFVKYLRLWVYFRPGIAMMQ